MAQDEVTQQELNRLQGRVQSVVEFYMAAHTVAKRLADAGQPDFTERIADALRQAEGLHGDISEFVGPVEAHRGLRTPPVCDDPNCPIHGDPPIEMTRCGVKTPRPPCGKQ